MKKLMIAAAAAAMVSGAFAEEVKYTYEDKGTWKFAEGASTNLFDGVMINLDEVVTNDTVITRYWDNKVSQGQMQILTYKEKAQNTKLFCLNDEKNEVDKFYKPTAQLTEVRSAVDGAIYYDGKKWVELRWSKDPALNRYREYVKDVPYHVCCYWGKDGKRIWGAPMGYFGDRLSYYYDRVGTKQVYGRNLVANWTYGEIDATTYMIKSIKSLNSSYTISIKTYKTEKSLDKAIDAIRAKFIKAGGLFTTAAK